MRTLVSGRFALMALAYCLAQPVTAQNTPPTSAEVEQHIQHVTSGLIGGVVIKGDEHATHTLADQDDGAQGSRRKHRSHSSGQDRMGTGLWRAQLGWAARQLPILCFRPVPSASPSLPWRLCAWYSKESFRSTST